MYSSVVLTIVTVGTGLARPQPRLVSLIIGDVEPHDSNQKAKLKKPVNEIQKLKVRIQSESKLRVKTNKIILMLLR